MFRRTKIMPAEEVFTRILFGIVLIGSSLFTWGKWVALILGFCFIISALTGVCLTCILFKKFFPNKDQ